MAHLCSEPFARGTELRLPARRPMLPTLITSSPPIFTQRIDPHSLRPDALVAKIR